MAIGMAQIGPRTLAVWDGPVEYEITVDPSGSVTPAEFVRWVAAQGDLDAPALSGFGDWLGKALDWITKNGGKVANAVKTVKGIAGQKSAMRRSCEQSGPTPACCAWARNPDPAYPYDAQIYCSGLTNILNPAAPPLVSGASNTVILLGGLALVAVLAMR
jgi:hypothetical protein